MISGIINILKPAGMTSNEVLNVVKKRIHPTKIGHLGTLDPSGTGVLPVCVGRATKLFDLYLKKEKKYRAVFVFGKETDTIDSDGEMLFEQDVDITQRQIEEILPEFIGNQQQIPPKYSAKKINGQKAYELARSGADFELKSREIEIFDIKLLKKLEKNTYLFEINCSAGTYIRSIARDISKRLDTVAYMGAIIRTKSGNFDIENSVMLDKVTEKDIIPLKNILKDRENIFVSDEFYDKIINGSPIKIDLPNKQNCAVYCKNQLIGIGNIFAGYLKINIYLWEKND